ncbi:hypothetical protein MYSTI_05446 [Myxococcus stipitatus DSM 14675]|uniref:Lipoprotein n=1 Tax=Myxococcus stipitatus (strain DSM 14675 / JCM 12634 / Mx s8) TaxID=1278073 RepID=L7UJU6_MYXSD|nr:hypothetical protein [Myxococcus stipitatus]AGC46724.1 hypothetical protein MYSTI_05446 [Myxococcus stipitatus DSM 14675]
MNAKALAAIVGTLSLASLATGCASTKAAEGQPAAAEKGAEGSCGAAKTEENKPAEGTDAAAPAATPEKGAEHSCGAGGCNGQKK